MGNIEALSLAVGTAWTSGINLYATVAALGLAGRLEMIQLPQGLELLTHPIVIAVACIMYAIEFFATKFRMSTTAGTCYTRSFECLPAPS